jgi:long-subunit acyl-CoA synthetase (AMP-forming)
VVDPQHKVTWAQLEKASAERAAMLVEAGVNKGHRIGLMAENGVEWAVARLRRHAHRRSAGAAFDHAAPA